VEVGTANQSGEPGYPRTIRFQIENDRLSGSDDGHTYSLRLFAEWPNRRPETSVSISYESLTFRKENTRVDLLGMDAAFAYPVWTNGKFAFTGGIAINGDLGGQALQNGVHDLLNEPGFDLDYPDGYSFGLTAGAGLDQNLADIGGFRITGSGNAKVSSSAAPNRVQGGIYLGRRLVNRRHTMLEVQFGVSATGYFWLDGILKPYYDEGYSLDSRLRLGYGWFAINMFFFSNPYGIDQNIFGVGFGFRF
jgi:hypothetical protein